MPVFSLAHLSDLHLPMTGLKLQKRRWLSKRGLSQLSWHFKRRKRHLGEVLSAMIDDIAASRAIHVAVTGDVTNTARPEEFERSLPWLRRLGDPRHVSLVPGNHDALVPLAHDRGQGLWQEWMGGDDPHEVSFPYVRRRGQVALVGVNTAVATHIFSATGRVGEEQLQRLEAMLNQLGCENLFRVILMHHPVTHGLQPRRKALIDQEAMRAMLKRTGAELILHGHTHRASLTAVAGPAGPIPTIGVPSASGHAGHEGHAARWHLYEVEEAPGGWQLRVTARRLDTDGRFHDIGHYTMAAPVNRAPQ